MMLQDTMKWWKELIKKLDIIINFLLFNALHSSASIIIVIIVVIVISIIINIGAEIFWQRE